jgi:hypothetical protein
MPPMWLRFARKTPTSSARSGIVVVEGKVIEGGKTLSIPGSQIRPVFYDLSFESYRAVPGGRGRFAWMVDRADLQIVQFIIEDEAGRMWINAERDHVVVKGGWNERGAVGKNATGRYHARLITPGDTVRVRGEAYEPKRAPVDRGLRATKERPLEILFRAHGEPPPAEVSKPAEGPRKGGRKSR